MNTFHYQINNYHDEDEWKEIQAIDMAAAACEAAEEYDQDDSQYPIASGDGTIDIKIKDAFDNVSIFQVRGWWRAVYVADDITRKTKNHSRKLAGLDPV